MTPERDSRPTEAAPQYRVLRRLFWTLMFRRPQRGRDPDRIRDPRVQFAVMLGLFSVVGCFSLSFIALGDFAFAASLHAMTFMLVGLNLATGSGSLLFNPIEADVLLHRPVEPRALLGAKVWVMVLSAAALAAALNLCGSIVGTIRHSNPLFAPAHLVSLLLLVLFCTSSVTLAYNVCLKWFGRERLDNLITTAQVVVAVGAMLGGQIVPRLIAHTRLDLSASLPKWLAALPPAWFGALDLVLSGRSLQPFILALAGMGVGATAVLTWLSVNRLANTYEQGLVTINEASPLASKQAGRSRWISRVAGLSGVRRWLRCPVERTAFILTFAGLTRARDVKLRVYPVFGQMLVYPIVILGTAGPETLGDFRIAQTAFAGAYLSLVPLMLLEQLRPSNDFQAAEIFQQAPLERSAAVFDGSRKAVLLLLWTPSIVLLALALVFWGGSRRELLLLLPGVLPIPAVALLPGLHRPFLPFSEPPTSQRGALGCALMFGFLLFCGAIAGAAWWAWTRGFYGRMLFTEAAGVLLLTSLLRFRLDRQKLQTPD